MRGAPAAAPALVSLALLPVAGLTVPGLGFPLALLVMVGAAGAVALVHVRHRLAPRPGVSALLLALLGVTLTGVVAGWWALDPDRALVLNVMGVAGLAHAAALGAALRTPAAVRGAVTVLVGAGVVVAVWVLATTGPVETHHGGGVITGRAQGPFAQPNELGALCGALLPAALVTGRAATSPLRRRAGAVAGGLIAVALVLSFSRSAWMGALAGVVMAAVLWPPVRRAAAAAVGLGVLAAVLAWFTPPTTPVLGAVGARVRSITAPTGGAHDHRDVIWSEAWQQVAEAPWWGIGPGSFESAAGAAGSAAAGAGPLHPHNALLTLAAERGLIGTALGVAVVVAALAVLRRSLTVAAVAPWAAAVAAGLFALTVHGLTDMPLRNPILTLLLWSLFGILIACERQQPHRPAPARARPDRKLVTP